MPNVVPPELKRLHLGLWVVQGLLAVAFLAAGVMKLVTPYATLAHNMAWVSAAPEALVRLIGLCEVAGALGLVLPAASHVRPELTASAGVGLTVLMVLATALHVSRGEFYMLPVTVGLGALAAFVAWGRTSRVPIAAREAHPTQHPPPRPSGA